jgi:hypothetical protein
MTHESLIDRLVAELQPSLEHFDRDHARQAIAVVRDHAASQGDEVERVARAISGRLLPKHAEYESARRAIAAMSCGGGTVQGVATSGEKASLLHAIHNEKAAEDIFDRRQIEKEASKGREARRTPSSDYAGDTSGRIDSVASGEIPVLLPQSSEITDTFELTLRIEESLAYFCDEFPKGERPDVWVKPISHHCGGITPDDLQSILSFLYAKPKPVSVDLEKCARAVCILRGWKPEKEDIDDLGWEDFIIDAKAVLDAAGVTYAD